MPKAISKSEFTGIAAGALLAFAAAGPYADPYPKSSFESAAYKLGFNSELKQDALLKIFYYAGYLDPHQLWLDLHRLGGIKDPEAVFKSLYPAIIAAHADQKDPSLFHPEILREKIFSDLSDEKCADLLLYIAQHAFNRQLGQERNELKSQDWMTQYKEPYIDAARTLGLIDRIKPSQEEYDSAWIAGASRVGVLARIVDYFNSNIKVKGETIVLAGGRELWAEIDGIVPSSLAKLTVAAQKGTNIDEVDISVPAGYDHDRTEEGKQYLIDLALRNGIELDQALPIIRYENKADCTAGRFPARFYPNYASGEVRKLDESLMSRDVLNSVGRDKGVDIVDTKAGLEGVRPNTSTTASDAAQNLVAKIKAGEFGDKKIIHIVFESNQPYIERQTLATQREVDSVLKSHGLDQLGYKVTVDGVGFRFKQDVTTIHSELGALVAEKTKAAIAQGVIPEHDLKPMMFQTRDSSSPVPDYPDTSTWSEPYAVNTSGEAGLDAAYQ